MDISTPPEGNSALALVSERNAARARMNWYYYQNDSNKHTLDTWNQQS